jgi:hypothetical protein
MSKPESKTEEKVDDRGTDGAMLDGRADSSTALPHGLVRLPSGRIAVTKLYCPAGHNLIDEKTRARFSRLPGIVLMVEGKRAKGVVVLSPIHGDDTKFGESGFEPGEVLKLSCPTCQKSFPVIQKCGCTDEANLVGLYLSEDLEEGNQVALCTAWGCLRSRIMDRFQIISKLE